MLKGKIFNMKGNIPVLKNAEYELNIDNMGYEGEGVGRIDDFTVFVPEALTGEKVKVKILRVAKSYAFGKLIDIIEPSAYRIQPVCAINKRCGGCQLQHLSYEGQLVFKKKRVEDCLKKISKFDIKSLIIHDTIGMDNPYRYRNKVQLPIGMENSELRIGFYAKRSHEIIDMQECFIQDEVADKVVKLTKEWINDCNIPVYDEKHHSGILRHLMIRKALRTGEIMIVLVTNGDTLPCSDKFISIMKENISGLKSIVQNINTQRTNVILSDKCITLWGNDTITDYIGSFRFNISPLSFFQVNPVQTEVLYSKVLEYAGLTGNETVFDAYCGTGTISLFLSRSAKKVYGVEIVPQAIENAIQNAEMNGVLNAEFLEGASEKIIPELISKSIEADVVTVDPPRKGCDRSLLEAIADMTPKKIIYVSCDPATLARDLAVLDTMGYKTQEVQPVDMFPQTAHVECVVLITRVEK